MPGIIRCYHHIDLTVNGIRNAGFGSVFYPVHETAILGGGMLIPGRELVIRPSEKVEVWNWWQTRGFELFAIRVIGGGYLNIAWQVQQVNNENEQVPSGNPVWHHASKSCADVLVIDSDRCMSHSSPSVVASDSSNMPALWSDDSAYNGVISRIVAWNRSTQSEVRASIYVVQ